MAIKAIGDLNTPESNAFLAAELKRWQSGPASLEATWTSQIIRMYLPAGASVATSAAPSARVG